MERVAIIEKAAELEMKAPRVGAWPPGHPADRPHTGDPLDDLDAEADMLALDLLRHRLVIEPAIAVADDFVALLDKGAGDLGVALGRLGHRQETYLHPEPAEQAQQAPPPDARAV